MTNNKVPPHSLDAEQSVLGAMILSEEAIVSVIDQLSAEDFYKPSHGIIFTHIVDIYSRNDRCDALTLADSLKRSDELDRIGGPETILSIQFATPAIGNASSYAKIVKDMATLRNLAKIGKQITQVAMDNPSDVDTVLMEAEASIYDVASHIQDRSITDAAGVLYETIEELSAAWLQPDGIVGTPTGFSGIDNKLSGFRNSALIVLGARPGMGKSALATNIACNVAVDYKLPVLYFNLEMSSTEVMQRILSYRSGVSLGAASDGVKIAHDDWLKINNAAIDISSSPLLIDSDPSVNAMDIYSRSRKAQSKFGQLGLIIVDYIQLMGGGKAESRQLEVSEISRKLKLLSKELNVPVLALSQLSRNLESRQDKRPMLSDLRESGSIEQDADVVAFLYKDSEYNQDTLEQGVVEFIIAKHRQGGKGTIKMAYIGSQTRFATIASGV
jgi:replicative DNA helicase